ncbi:uncharacterized protein LOC108093566 [Trichonephila clavipes]|nr:uncharacterized protein LOC108093566 [Trichonephila clavipes]
MTESKNSEEISNAVIVQIDVHHRPGSQLNASIATIYKQCSCECIPGKSDRSAIHRGYPKTDAERAQEYRARKKAKIQLADSTIAESINSEEFSNSIFAQVYVHHRHCSQLSASIEVLFLCHQKKQLQQDTALSPVLKRIAKANEKK